MIGGEDFEQLTDKQYIQLGEVQTMLKYLADYIERIEKRLEIIENEK